MRRVFATAAVLAIALPAGASAQQSERAPFSQRGGAERIVQLRQELGLTAVQVTRIQQIGAQLREQNRPLIEQLQAARPVRDSARAQLTPEQRAQLRQRAENLTPEQRAQLRQRMENLTPGQREQLRQRMENLTPGQREQLRKRVTGPRAGVQRPPTELQPVMQQLRQNTQAAAQQVREVLTAEQQQKLRELRPAVRDGQSQPGARRAPAAERGDAQQRSMHRSAERGARGVS